MRRMAGKLIIRRTERRVACKSPILRTVDQLLWMLNARADRKGLLHHLNPLPIERFHRIPRGMADGEDHRIGFEIDLTALRITVSNAMHRAVSGDHAEKPAGKQNGSAQRHNFLPHGFDNRAETVCADVGFGVI